MKNRGFTLIELAVVLAIIAVLAAVLTPVVTNYVDQARISRAMADVRTVADAIKLHRRDTGYWPIFANLTAARDNNSTTHKLIGTGQTPSNGHANWSNFTTSSDLVTIVNTNLGFSTASDVSNPGRAAFRGPYIGALDADPWGNYYVVTASNLAGTSNRAFVVSAGPNGTLDIDPQQGVTSITNSTDDIVAPIN